jgi:hypothetical protein
MWSSQLTFEVVVDEVIGGVLGGCLEDIGVVDVGLVDVSIVVVLDIPFSEPSRSN